jgi:hypothetical protein
MWLILKLVMLMNHIVDHGYQLWDLDGTPTTFGRWDPDHVTENEIRFKQGDTWQRAGQYWMDGLEIISYLRAAYHITGEKKFYDHYRILIDKHGYDVRAANWQNIFIAEPMLYNFSDDELAFFSNKRFEQPMFTICEIFASHMEQPFFTLTTFPSSMVNSMSSHKQPQTGQVTALTIDI